MSIPQDFNPYSLIRETFNSRYHSPPPEFVKRVQHARIYIENWETMFNEKRSRYAAISTPATSQEQQIVANSVGYLGDLLLHLDEFSATDDDFKNQFESHINTVAPSTLWADTDLHLPVSHLIADSTIQTLFFLRDTGKSELIGVIAASSLFCFIRYADWITEREKEQF